MKKQVHIFVPCFIDQLFPITAVNMVQVLRKAGCEVHYNTSQTCCAQPAFNAGFVEEARGVAAKTLNEFDETMAIVSPSASCISFVKEYYSELFKEDTVSLNKVSQIKPRLFEFAQFLVDELGQVDFGASLKGKAVYHDACSALRGCGIKEAPRRLLEAVHGLELLEAPDAEVCCGFGGTFSTKFEPVSVAMAEKKVLTALELGADYILSTDLSCLMQLQGYIDAKGFSIKTLHIADVLVA
jgi:L-lactate dehydrogenase complex protein LldE